MAKLLENTPEEIRPDSHKINQVLLSLAYSTGSLDKALESFKKLQFSSLSDLPRHERIFSVATRKDIFDSDIQNSCGLMPMPELNGKRYCHPVSESVFVPINSRYPEIAFQLAANTLSDQFQQAVALTNDNLPANRDIAEKHSCRKSPGDDVFFQEIDNIHYPREIIDPLSTAVILMGLKEFAGNRLSINDFTNLLIEEKRNIIRRKKAIENILEHQLPY
jgi:hypothetical protein